MHDLFLVRRSEKKREEARRSEKKREEAGSNVGVSYFGLLRGNWRMKGKFGIGRKSASIF